MWLTTGCRVLAGPVAMLAVAFATAPAPAQDEPRSEGPPAEARGSGEATAAADPEGERPRAVVEEVMVVTASRAEQSLHEAPAAMS